MRLPSFIKLPDSRRFKFAPRHFDPIKDELDQRVSESKNTKKKFFKRNRNQNKLSTSRLQLLIAFILSFLIFGWLYLGNKIFIFIILIPLWFLLKKWTKK
jgi:hypothetical protein